MPIEFRLMTEEESAAAQAEWERWAAAEDERKALVQACGKHAWELHLDDPEDGAGVALVCAKCPAHVGDVFLDDGTEMICAEFDDGVVVGGGRHNSPVALVVPVSVEVWGSKTWTDMGWDYDAGIEIWPRDAEDEASVCRAAEAAQPAQPSPRELWLQSGGDTPQFSGERYRQLMIEHGLLIPLKPDEKAEPLPCGWPHGRTEEAADA